MENLSWDIHQALREMTIWSQQEEKNRIFHAGENHSYLGSTNHKDQYIDFDARQKRNEPITFNNSSDVSMHTIRRILRRLDRLVRRLEQEMIQLLHNPYSSTSKTMQVGDGNVVDGCYSSDTVVSGQDITGELSVTQTDSKKSKGRMFLDQSWSGASSSNNSEMYGNNKNKRQRMMADLPGAPVLEQLRDDIMKILIFIPILFQDDSAFQSSSSVLQSTSRVWLMLSENSLLDWMTDENEFSNTVSHIEANQTIDKCKDVENEVINLLLERILQYTVKIKSNMHTYCHESLTDLHTDTSIGPSLVYPLLAWLQVANNFYDNIDSSRYRALYRSMTGAVAKHATNPGGSSIVTRRNQDFLPMFVQVAIDYVRMKEWDCKQLQNPCMEANIQFRIATVHIINQLITRYSTVQLKQPCMKPGMWLACCFNELDEPSLSPNDKKQQYLFDDCNNQVVVQFLKNVATYASELADYAIDVMDGVALTLTHFGGPAPAPSDHHLEKVDNVNGMNNAAKETSINREEVEQDCLRHLSLAIGYMSSIQVWYENDDTNRHQILEKQRRLWLSLSTGLLELSKPFETERFGWQLCQNQLLLTNLLAKTQIEWNIEEITTLSLIFLRTIEYPDLLLSDTASCLWTTLTNLFDCNDKRTYKNYTTTTDLRYTLQVAYLTLRDSNLIQLPQNYSKQSFPANSKQEQIRLLMEKLLSLLTITNKVSTGITTGQDMIQKENPKNPWDRFFFEQFQFE
jgi:hypothetical protein